MHYAHIAPICAVQGSFAGHYGLGLNLGHGVDTDGGLGILATVAAMPADWGGAANDNPAPCDQFFYLLDLGLDPADLGSDLRGVVGDPKRLFLDRLSNIYGSLRALKPPGWGQLDRKGCLSAAQTPHDHEFEERRTRANAVPVEDIMAKAGWKLRRIGDELKGACPSCGEGDDRLYVRRDNSWGCRQCGAERRHGNDSIGMYRLLHGGCSFRMALDVLAPPLGSGTQKAKSGGDGAGAKASGTASAPGKDDAAANATPGEFPPRTPPDKKGEPLFVVAGEEGPKRAKNELRRHVYHRGRGAADVLAAVPVRVKIKYSKRDGKAGWVNWYRVVDKGGAGAIGWQRGKPKTGYVDVPYVTLGSNPFDPETDGDRKWWTEGEKDTDTITKMGGLAFTFGGGEGQTPGVEAWAAANLKGRAVVIPADNDETGRKQAQKKASLARKVGARSVRIVEFKDVPEGEDVSWAHEHGLDMDGLDALADAAPEWIGVVGGGGDGAGLGTNTELPWDYTERGKLRAKSFANTYNTLLQLGHTFQYDTFHDWKLVNSKELSDGIARDLRERVVRKIHLDSGKENIEQAIERLCEAHPFDPVVDYLARVQHEWDGKFRIDAWLTTYLGAPDTKLNCAIGRRVLIGAARRARQPSTKFDEINVLEGEEGKGKSTAIEILAGPENFSDQTILGKHISDRDMQEKFKGVWLYEIADLTGMGRSDVEAVKAMASRITDRGRPAYGHYIVRQPRRCVLFATTNDDEYLKS
jgi:Virulence-associated protein E